MKHPIAITLMFIVFGLGIGTGYIIHTTRGSASQTPKESVALTSPETETGEVLGFVKSLESSGGRVYVSLDSATLYRGAAAIDAAILNGACTPERPEDCAPNDYYIENNSAETKWYALSPDVLITRETLSHRSSGADLSGEVISLSEFRQLFENPQSALAWRRLPFWITLERGEVTEIREQYIP